MLIYALSTFSAVLPQAVSSEAESIAAAILTDDDLQHIVDLINNRPRKRLGFRTPISSFVDFVALDLTICHVKSRQKTIMRI